MKRICIFILIPLLVFAGCQPTPESSLIVGKDQQQMIETAQGDTAYSTDAPAPAEGINWAERLGAPEQYTASLTSAGGHLTVAVDAAVALPDVELPVARVEPYVFTDEDVLRFVHALLGEDPTCMQNGENWRTRAMWEREILQLKDDLDHWEEYGEQIWDSYDTKAEFEKHLQEVIAQAANAPEEPTIIPFALNWEHPNVWTKGGQQETTDSYATVLVLNEDGTASSLTIDRGTEYVRCGLRYMREAGEYIHFPYIHGGWQNELPLTEAGARQLAEAKLKEMGLDHLSCTYASPTRVYRGDTCAENAPYDVYWALVFTREVNGARQGYTYQQTVEPSEYNAAYTYEQCRVLVDEQGVAYLEYESPWAVDEVKVDAATLLPFEKVREIFEKMVLIVDNNADIYSQDQHYHITAVRLSLVSLPEQDGDGCLLVPCWDFLGDSPLVYQALADMGLVSDGAWCYLTVNAVDGSIIQRQ